MEELTDEEVLQVLSASGNSKRKRKLGKYSTPRYSSRIARQAGKLIDLWLQNGIPKNIYENLQAVNSSVIEKYGFHDPASWLRDFPIDQTYHVSKRMIKL